MSCVHFSSHFTGSSVGPGETRHHTPSLAVSTKLKACSKHSCTELDNHPVLQRNTPKSVGQQLYCSEHQSHTHDYALLLLFIRSPTIIMPSPPPAAAAATQSAQAQRATSPFHITKRGSHRGSKRNTLPVHPKLVNLHDSDALLSSTPIGCTTTPKGTLQANNIKSSHPGQYVGLQYAVKPRGKGCSERCPGHHACSRPQMPCKTFICLSLEQLVTDY
jgi:hypothetical protein